MAPHRGVPPLVLILIGLVVLVATPPRPAAAQHPFTPGVGFGARVFPDISGGTTAPRTSWALQFDLFTELSKDLEPPPSTDFLRYNDIDRTIGVNQLGYSRVAHQQLGSGSFYWHRAFWVAGGVVWDAPTEFLQNDFAHDLRRLTFVPRDGTVDHVAVGVGTDQTLSAGAQLGSWIDVVGAGGLGTGLSTTWFDGYGQLAGRVTVGPTGSWWFQLGGVGRVGHVGDPFLWEGFRPGIDGWYQMLQGSVTLPVGGILNVPVLARLHAGYTRSWGPWVETVGGPDIVEQLVHFRVETAHREVAIEFWNDLGFKDLGPTFGLRIEWARTP